MKLKVCGMNYHQNIIDVAKLQPDYLGFIFYEKSSRFFEGTIPDLSESVQKVGVFVDASLEDILERIKTHNLQAVQLHGNETVAFCNQLKTICDTAYLTEHSQSTSEASHSNMLIQIQPHRKIDIIKVFSIKDGFDFSRLEAFEDVCDYFLFDTKGQLPGGNGYTFNWKVLDDYKSTKPFFLSGGIGIHEIKKLKAFQNTKAATHCYAIDVNSKFEIKPGLKNSKELEKFKYELQH